MENISTTAIAEYESWRENMKIMAQITDTMRLEVQKSEIPSDRQTLERVEFPEEGGILTYMTGHEYPYQGFPYYDFVEKLDSTKKIGRATLSGLYHAMKKNKVRLIFLLPAAWFFKETLRIAVYASWKLLSRYKMKPYMYSCAVREIYRAFTVNQKNENEELKLMIRDVVCMFLEFDNAYRFRVQDWASDFSKKRFEKHPIFELRRIMGIAISRETSLGNPDTWVLFKTFLPLFLLLDKELFSILKNVIKEIQVKKVMLTESDKHWVSQRTDYKFLCQ